jgi:hypothetical protein
LAKASLSLSRAEELGVYGMPKIFMLIALRNPEFDHNPSPQIIDMFMVFGIIAGRRSLSFQSAPGHPQ